MNKRKQRFMEKLGKILQEERKSRKKSQCSVAELIGVHQTALSRIEWGAQQMTVYEFSILCKDFNLDPSDILRQIHL